MQENVIVVGASVAGTGALSELRNSGYSGPITLIDAQVHLPYDRPPLSKALLTGERAALALAFHDQDHYERLDVTMRLGQRARGINPEAIAVELESGESVSVMRSSSLPAPARERCVRRARMFARSANLTTPSTCEPPCSKNPATRPHRRGLHRRGDRL